MTEFGKRLDGPGGRRRARRAPVLMPVALHIVGASRTVSITDVSKTGARIRSGLELQIGEQVWLKIPPSSDVFGKVQWIKGDTYGIAFDEPLGDAVTSRLVARGKVVIMPRLSLEEQLAVEDWKAGFAR